MIDLDFIAKLNRFLTDHPGSITSLTRTDFRNSQIGGAPESAHRFKYGNAVDLVFDSVSDLYHAAAASKSFGFTGIELDLTNFHLHLDTKPRVWMVVHRGPHQEEPLEQWLNIHLPTRLT